MPIIVEVTTYFGASPMKVAVPKKVYDKIASRARVGARFLDKRRPGWFWRIKTTKLDMQDGCKCIYGQLHAEDLFEEVTGCHLTNGNTVEEHIGYLPPSSVADFTNFNSAHEEAAWAVLQEEWLREIKVRRDAAKT